MSCDVPFTLWCQTSNTDDLFNHLILFDMKTNVLNVFVALALLFVLSSCKKDKEPMNDVLLPTVQIELPDDREQYWNTISIEVKATSPDAEIATVELFANGQVLDAKQQAPYIFEWNTRDFADGEVELKAVATDSNNKSAEAKTQVTVLNTLLSIEIPKGYLLKTFSLKYFVFITNEERELMYFSQIEEEPFAMVVERPENFDDASFDLHFIAANPLSAQMHTYADFPAGNFKPRMEESFGKELDDVQVSFFDIPAHDFFQFDNSLGFTLSNVFPYTAKSYENLDFAYLYLRNGENGIYKFVENLSASPEYEISLNATPFQMSKHKLSYLSPVSAYTYEVKGHTGPGVLAPHVRMFSYFGDNQANGIEQTFHTPSNETRFDHFSGELKVQEGNTLYTNSTYYNIPLALVKRNIHVQVSGHQLVEINNTVSGDTYDVLRSNYIINSPNVNLVWNCYSRDAQIEFPPIPTQLTQAFNNYTSSNIVFKEAKVLIEAQDYDHLDSYDDYLKALSGRTGTSFFQGATRLIAAGKQFNY